MKNKMYYISFGIIVCAFFELLGFGAIAPLIMSILSPEKVAEIPVLAKVLNFLPFPTVTSVAVVALFCFLLKTFIILYFTKKQIDFYSNLKQKLSSNLFDYYLYKPLEFHLNINSSVLMRNLHLVDCIVDGVLLPTFYIFSELVVLAFIYVIILYMNFYLAIGVIVIFGLSLVVYFFYTGKKLKQWGQQSAELTAGVVKVQQQSFHSVKEILANRLQPYFTRKYIEINKEVKENACKLTFFAAITRSFVETFGIVVVIGSIVVASFFDVDKAKLFGLLSFIGLATIRLLPSLNRIASAINNIKFNTHALTELYNELVEIKTRVPQISKADFDKLDFKSIELKNISFAYGEKKVLHNVSLNIQKGQKVAFVGASGSGKTTLVDIILGLLKPQDGTVQIDGANLETIEDLWAASIGYIPQSPYFSDGTIEENIAIGVEKTAIDKDHIQEVMMTSDVSEFTKDANLNVGEMGAKLSGGQRQRISIARALYGNPKLIVMDEATAALDNKSEKKIVEAISKLGSEQTVLMIAHRLTTIKNCDVIYYISHGTVTASGTYNELYLLNAEFKDLVDSSRENS